MQHLVSSRPRRSTDRATLGAPASVLVTTVYHPSRGIATAAIVGSRAVVRGDTGDGDQIALGPFTSVTSAGPVSVTTLPAGPLGARAESNDGMVTR
jgi:hypothetical protein